MCPFLFLSLQEIFISISSFVHAIVLVFIPPHKSKTYSSGSVGEKFDCYGKRDEPLILSGPKTVQESTATSLSDTKNSIRVREFPNSHVDGSLCLAPPIDAMPTDFSSESFAFFPIKYRNSGLQVRKAVLDEH